MYNNKFVLSIIQDGRPVKETGWGNNKEIAIPFDSEYKIRLKNKNNRSCTARVLIDGKKVSNLGDVIVTAGGTIDLERYIDRSLVQGKKFKFVPLDHPDVDDPTSSSNGVIEVEFRKAKHQNGIKLDHDWNWCDFNWAPPYREDNNGPQYYGDGGSTAGAMCDSVQCYSAGGEVKSSRSFVSAGATVEGSKSNQQFSYSNLEVEDYVVTLKLKIIGIEKNKITCDLAYKYCSACGSKIKRVDKYCSECGHRA
jgi:hypothetical protein